MLPEEGQGVSLHNICRFLWYNMGVMLNWLRRHWRWVVAAILIVIACALVSAFRSHEVGERILTFFDDWSVALGAGAAVILAVAAFKTIKISSEQKQLLSNQTEFLNDQIRFLRQERLLKILDDVHTWANDMTSFRLESQKGKTPEQIRVFFVVHWTAVLKANETNGESLKRQTEKIWPFLGSAIDEVLKSIIELSAYLLIEYKGTKQIETALRKTHAINASAQNLLITVDGVKSSVLSQE